MAREWAVFGNLYLCKREGVFSCSSFVYAMTMVLIAIIETLIRVNQWPCESSSQPNTPPHYEAELSARPAVNNNILQYVN